MTRIFTLIVSLLLAMPSLANAPLVIDLPALGVALQYPQAVRLEKALGDIDKQSAPHSIFTYPLMSRLYNVDKQAIAEQTKQQTIDSLRKLALQLPKQKTNLIHLLNQIETWDVGYREHVNLDLDVVRITKSQNPMLRGHFTFESFARPTSITLAGLIASPSEATLTSGFTAADYLNRAIRLRGANNSVAWLITPDGLARQIGYAYWNDQHTALAPGSTLFVGFDSTQPELQALEQQIMTLIGSKKGQQ